MKVKSKSNNCDGQNKNCLILGFVFKAREVKLVCYVDKLFDIKIFTIRNNFISFKNVPNVLT